MAEVARGQAGLFLLCARIVIMCHDMQKLTYHGLL